MKKITICMSDTTDLGPLFAAASAALSMNVETISDEAKPKAKTRTYMPSGKTLEATIMEHYSPQATFNGQHADMWAAKAGYGKETGSSCLSKLAERGFIKEVGKNGRVKVWQFVRPYTSPKLAASA